MRRITPPAAAAALLGLLGAAALPSCAPVAVIGTAIIINDEFVDNALWPALLRWQTVWPFASMICATSIPAKPKDPKPLPSGWNVWPEPGLSSATRRARLSVSGTCWPMSWL